MTHRARPAPTRFILTATIVALTAYFLIPMVWMLFAATKSTADLNTTFGFWFARIDLVQNLRGPVRLPRRRLPALGAELPALLGRRGPRRDVPGRPVRIRAGQVPLPRPERLMGVIFGGVLIPGTVLALPTYLLLNSMGLINTYWAVILPSLSSAFGVFLVRIYTAAAVPDELLEAGRIDGAHDLRVFFTVVLRILLPSLVTVFLFSFISIWNNFLLPLIVLNDQSLWPVTLGLYSWQLNAMSEPDLVRIVVTGSMVGTIPLVILFLSLQKYWRSGITTGAIK